MHGSKAAYCECCFQGKCSHFARDRFSGMSWVTQPVLSRSRPVGHQCGATMQVWAFQVPRRTQGCLVQGEEELTAAGPSRSRTPRGRALRCVSAQEIRAKLCGDGILVMRGAHAAVLAHPDPLMSSSSAEWWDFPPARPGAPSRKSYRRGSLKFVRSLRGR